MSDEAVVEAAPTGAPTAGAAVPAAAVAGGALPDGDPQAQADASLVALVGRLSALLAGSDLSELEIRAGGTSLVLRKPAEPATAVFSAAVAPSPAADPPFAVSSPPASGPGAAAAPDASARSDGQGGRSPRASASAAPSSPSGSAAATSAASAAPSAGHSGRLVVAAPLTGVWYASATPGGDPFVAVGSSVAVGQVIGLIEAMKLFNEIKSDRAGKVARIVPENGALVRAKQPLIEVEPL